MKKTKISSTAYRVLLLMKLLNEDELNIDDLNSIFSSDLNIARTFSKEVILKYISTLKLAGYEISKPCLSNKHSYRLVKSPTSIKLTNEDISTLAILEDYVLSLYQEKLHKNYTNFLEKISRYMTEDQIAFLNKERKKHKDSPCFDRSNYSKYAQLIKIIERYCVEEQRIIVRYKLPVSEEMQIALEPKSIKYDSKDVYLCGYNPITGERQLLHFDYIQEVKQLPIKSKYSYILSPVIFKLKGRLAKGYRPYAGEKIPETNSDNTVITITAYVDDKEMLLQRLLKYGDSCEILYPKSIREKVKSIIQKTLKNYNIDV